MVAEVIAYGDVFPSPRGELSVLVLQDLRQREWRVQRVSVPSRGIISSNARKQRSRLMILTFPSPRRELSVLILVIYYYLSIENAFPSPRGELSVLMCSPGRISRTSTVSVPLRGIISFNRV